MLIYASLLLISLKTEFGSLEINPLCFLIFAQCRNLPYSIFHVFSSGMHIFKHFYLWTLASRGGGGHYLVFLALSIKVVMQGHLFVDHFYWNWQLYFSLMYPSKIFRDIDMCFRRIKFRHKTLACQIIVIPHTKRVNVIYWMYLKLWKVLD